MLAVHQPTYRPLTRCGAEELAVHATTAKTTGGLLFARKKERGEKDEARHHLLQLLTPERFPKLSILSMPGADWKFERKLFGLRERDWYRKAQPERTSIYAIENDRLIYHGAVLGMPGMQTRKPLAKVLPANSYAERCVGTRWVERFEFGNVDDLMRAASMQYDVVWLDYTGPLSVQRIRLIRQFFDTSVRSLLCVTALKARWNRETSDAITKAGTHSGWFWNAMGGQQVHEINYQDGASPMTQFALSK